MEANTGPLIVPNQPLQPNIDKIVRRLSKEGIQPTPKIIHTLRKKELQKYNRRLAKLRSNQPITFTESQEQAIAEENQFQVIKYEYKKFKESLKFEENRKMVGRPWEGLERLRVRELASENMEYGGEKLRPERLRELSDLIESEKDKLSWLLDDDVEYEKEWFTQKDGGWASRKRSEAEAIKFFVERLSETELRMKDWKFSRIMRHSGLQFTENQMLKIVEGLGNRKQWRHAMSVVEWLYNSKEFRHYKSRFVYTKLLAVLGRAGKPREALHVFNLMRGDAFIYPDMAAYHSMAVTLGQSGCLKELVSVIQSMKIKPKRVRNMKHKSWDPVLQPDVVILNAVLNACVPTRQWKGVSWVFDQLRRHGLRPNGATYGLAMEVMLQSGRYDLVHELFVKMKRSGEALKGLTYKVLVKAFWREGKVDQAVQAVRDMERRGIVGIASVYYELARCLCFYGRWQEALLEIQKLQMLHPTRPLAVAFSGIILSSLDGGHVRDCISIFEHYQCVLPPDIGVINAMLRVYGRNDMFLEGRKLFEETKKNSLVSQNSVNGHISSPNPDAFTFGSMLEASASALQWEYFDYVYKEMILTGHRLDLNKHSSLLVEASRAGKWHLLEHAFEAMLESGEIPPASFFTEMVCQAIFQHAYGKAVNIINTMAHAPFQVSFQHWIDLFETNEDMIDRASLNELHTKLVSRDLVNEATVLNLSRALQYLCGLCDKPLNSVVSDRTMISEISSDGCDGTLNGNEKMNAHKFSVKLVCPNPSKTAGIHEGDPIYIVNDKDCSTTREGIGMDMENGRTCSTRLDEQFEYDSETVMPVSDSDGQESEHLDNGKVLSEADDFNFEHYLPANEGEDSHEYDFPSAYDILESWKETNKR